MWKWTSSKEIFPCHETTHGDSCKCWRQRKWWCCSWSKMEKNEVEMDEWRRRMCASLDKVHRLREMTRRNSWCCCKFVKLSCMLLESWGLQCQAVASFHRRIGSSFIKHVCVCPFNFLNNKVKIEGNICTSQNLLIFCYKNHHPSSIINHANQSARRGRGGRLLHLQRDPAKVGL